MHIQICAIWLAAPEWLLLTAKHLFLKEKYHMEHASCLHVLEHAPRSAADAVMDAKIQSDIFVKRLHPQSRCGWPAASPRSLLRVVRAAWAPPSPCIGASASRLRTLMEHTSWALECCCFASFQLLCCGLLFVVTFSAILPFCCYHFTHCPFVCSLPPYFYL